MVRDRRVYLKTVGGLRQVNVILRRVDDSFCDPLELRGDSFLGVTGLVEAVAAGNVHVANALGSGLIETAAIMPFLPGLSKYLLGEPLKLPSVATWWCGQDYALAEVLGHLDSVVVKPAFPSRGMEPVFGAQLAKAEKQHLTDQLRSRPYEYVAQEQVALSIAPVWDAAHLWPQRGLANLCIEYREAGDCPAGRTGASRRLGRPGGVHAKRRSQQGCLGALGWSGRHFQHAASARSAAGTAPRIDGCAKPGCR